MKLAYFPGKLFAVLFMGILILISEKSNARNVGVMGETYQIAEVDFLDFIESRIEAMQKNGKWGSVENRIQQDAIQYRDRPKKVDGITRAIETKIWQWDPSIVLDHDVATLDGKIIAPAGTKVNPLQFVPLTKTLVFYNSDDQDQVKWVISLNKKLKDRTKLILVNGSILKQEKLFKKPIYFDQNGKLTSRFGITHVPAIVAQKKWMLCIMEVKV